MEEFIQEIQDRATNGEGHTPVLAADPEFLYGDWTVSYPIHESRTEQVIYISNPRGMAKADQVQQTQNVVRIEDEEVILGFIDGIVPTFIGKERPIPVFRREEMAMDATPVEWEIEWFDRFPGVLSALMIGHQNRELRDADTGDLVGVATSLGRMQVDEVTTPDRQSIRDDMARLERPMWIGYNQTRVSTRQGLAGGLVIESVDEINAGQSPSNWARQAASNRYRDWTMYRDNNVPVWAIVVESDRMQDGIQITERNFVAGARHDGTSVNTLAGVPEWISG